MSELSELKRKSEAAQSRMKLAMQNVLFNAKGMDKCESAIREAFTAEFQYEAALLGKTIDEEGELALAEGIERAIAAMRQTYGETMRQAKSLRKLQRATVPRWN